MPSLLYGSELWGIMARDSIEKVLWFRLRRQPLCRHSRKAYDMLYGLQEINTKAKTWVYHVKCLLCVNEFEYVWMYGEAGDERRFLRIERLKILLLSALVDTYI